jgi:hypothetical protein
MACLVFQVFSFQVLQYNEHIGVVAEANVDETFTAGEAPKG